MRAMNTTLPRLLGPLGLIFALVVPVSADPPKKPEIRQFSRLINESPFTIKPAPPKPGKVTTPLERDWTLGSIRPGKDGYTVTLINKKDRKDRIRFMPGFSTGDFKLLKVEQDSENSLNSRVRVSKGGENGVTAWLTYDEKLIQVKPSVAAAKSNKSGGTSNKDAQNSRKSSSGKESRKRIITNSR